MKIWILLGAASGDPDVYPNNDVVAGQTPEWQVSDALWDRSVSYDAIDPLKVAENIGLARENWAKGEPVEVVFPSMEERDFFWNAVLQRMQGDFVSDIAPYASDIFRNMVNTNGFAMVKDGWMVPEAPEDDGMTP